MKHEANIVNIAKDLIAPADIKAGGTLRPEESERLISTVFKTDFLSKVNTKRMSRTKSAIDVFDIAKRQLVRVAEGTEPTDNQDVTDAGAVMTALSVQLFPSVTLSFLRDNKDNPNLVQTVEMAFADTLTRDLVDLGFNGTSDTATGSTADEKFLALNKGWVQVAKDNAAVIDVTKAKANMKWVTYLGNVLKAADDRYKNDSVFIMNTGDADAYGIELGGHVTGTALVADSPLRRFQGRQIIGNAYMPTGTILFTPINNLVFGMSTEIRRDRDYHSRKRVIEYTFDMAVDYEIAVKKAVVLGQTIIPAPVTDDS